MIFTKAKVIKRYKKLPRFVVLDFKASFLAKLVRITPSHLHSSVFNKNSNRIIKLPRSFCGYSLVKDFQPDKPYPFKIGLYKDKYDKKYVAKIWEGSSKNLHYYNLVNEIVATHTLSNLRKRLERDLNENLLDVYTPSFVEVITGRNKIIFVTKYLSGKRFYTLSEDRKIRTYRKCIKYFEFLANNLSEKEISLIRVKKGLDIAFQYPLIFTAALLKRPNLAPLLFKGLRIFIQGVPYILNGNNYTIVHGDINYDNVLIEGNKISIIDIEQLMYTFPHYEDIATISSARNTKTFTNWIIKKNLEICFQDIAFTRLFCALVVNCETHNLTGNSSDKSFNNHFRRLKLGIMISDAARGEKNKYFYAKSAGLLD